MKTIEQVQLIGFVVETNKARHPFHGIREWMKVTWIDGQTSDNIPTPKDAKCGDKVAIMLIKT